MKHPQDINYPGGFKQLAEDLGNLHYELLSEFLSLLSEKLARDSDADKGRGRPKLSSELFNASLTIRNASIVCKPHME